MTFFFLHLLLLSSFWTSRGHRWCRPFFPPGSCLPFLLRIGFSINPTKIVNFFLSSRALLTHTLSSPYFSASQFVRKQKSLRIYTKVCTRGDSNSRNSPSQMDENWYTNESVWSNPFTTGNPFLDKSLGFSLGRGLAALKGLSFFHPDLQEDLKEKKRKSPIIIAGSRI